MSDSSGMHVVGSTASSRSSRLSRPPGTDPGSSPPRERPEPDVFMSVGVCKRVMLSARAALLDYGIDPEDPELGIPLRGMAYRAMTDVSADVQCGHMVSEEKSGMARDIVVRFYSEVARARGSSGGGRRGGAVGVPAGR